MLVPGPRDPGSPLDIELPGPTDMEGLSDCRHLASNCSDEIARQAIVESEQGTGGSCDYYKALVKHPTTDGVDPYMAECNDIIEALKMTPAEANVFKATWRTSASRLGRQKAGNEALRDAQKVQFFGRRMEVAARTNDDRPTSQP